MSDYYNIIDSAVAKAEKIAREEGREEGRVEGRAEGITEGRESAKLEDAAKLKALGVSVEIISQATGLSVETIENL